MQVAEVLLRVGCGLVAWMVLYAYVIWIAAMGAIDCGPEKEELMRLLLGIAPLAIIGAVSVRVTKPLQEIHNMLRWLGAPLVLLLPFSMMSVWSVLSRVTIGGESFCTNNAPTLWLQSWAPIQLATICLVIWLIVTSGFLRPNEKSNPIAK